MAGIALAAILLGQFADRFGRRTTIVAGLTLFGAACFLLAAGDNFLVFAVPMGLSGLAIGVFKTGALALIGDISTSTTQHTAIMNTAEGFFGVGAIIGPAILAWLLAAGLPWTWLYVIAGTMCVALIVLALLVKYPVAANPAGGGASRGSAFSGTGRAMKSPYILAFSAAAFLFVGVEAAVSVWMPPLLAGYTGSATTLAAYSISIFFLLRAAGRFGGRVDADVVPLAARAGAVQRQHPRLLRAQRGRRRRLGGVPAAAVGPVHVGDPSHRQFEGDQCLPRSEHGAGAGVILFFTCVSAVMAPMAIGAVGDAAGDIAYGFWLATGSAALLFSGLLLNWLLNPTRAVLEQLDITDYRQGVSTS